MRRNKKTQNKLNDTLGSFEVDDGFNKQYTDKLTDRISTLKITFKLKWIMMK